jgi:hypothetical protein
MPFHINEVVYLHDRHGYIPGIVVGAKDDHGARPLLVQPDNRGPRHRLAREVRIKKAGDLATASRDLEAERALKDYNKMLLKRRRQTKKAKGSQRKTRKN